MSVVVVTGSAGLIGSAAARFFHERDFEIVGIDNDMRQYFFGVGASTEWSRRQLEEELPRYRHYDIDIRDREAIDRLFEKWGDRIVAVIHSAAQPSHDWAATEPFTDFSVNAGGTLTLLEATRAHCPEACFVFTSTNKVYGDLPNGLPLVELETRWELETSHRFYANGIDESLSIDQSTHSLFGASKTAADLMVQEYGRYFGLKTAVFRGGCLTGGGHAGAELHGFLSYLVRCCLEGRPYTIYGYQGKQVRDNIHAEDLVEMFWHFIQRPRAGAVYNAGGGRANSCSMREAISLCEEMSGCKLDATYVEENRRGDHIWYISDTSRFRADYPDWSIRRDLPAVIESVLRGWRERL